MKKILATITALVLSVTLLTACSGIELANIAAKNKDITIEKGGTEVLELVVSLSKTDATQEETAKVLETAKITWTSADANIVETKENTITAKAVGSTVVTAKTEDGKFTADFNITVIVSPTGIAAPEEIAIDIDSKEANPIGASVLPADATNVKIIYKSSDEKIATVDENGNITAVGKGSCVISSSIEESNSVSQEPVGTVDEAIKAETKVTVKTIAKEISLAKTSGSINVGGTVTLAPKTTPSGAETTYTFSSDDTKVASVSDKGVIKGEAAGTATITVTSAEGLTVTYVVTVKAKAATPANTTGTTAGTKTPAASNAATPPASNPVTPPVAPPVAPPAPVAPEPPAPNGGGGVDHDDTVGDVTPGEDLHPGTGGF